ncbi:protein suppressor of white apricot [Anopheles merus]|uniref:SURP motif domain-containing protein n=1 Tax=Anopheles merus TaxID=30066 RepID=A0A182V0X7_ANOME|nr:protein suppressor of white apricot [Anopheles merus]
MSERWNIANSALRGGLGINGMGSGSNAGGSNGVGNGVGNSLGHHPGVGVTAAADGGGGSIGGAGVGIKVGIHGAGGSGTITTSTTTTFSAANGESGILRRTGHYHHHGGTPDNFDDLLVFGYSCKVFRDDERARFIDQGRHLIPWMGDNQLKIDRYDARGALHDLSPYEPPPGGYQNRLEGLTAAEQKAEQLCEEERYYSLYNNEVEEEMYQEEARKRETMLGNQVPFNYDAPAPQEGATVATVEERTGTSADEHDDDPYQVPKGFEIPPDIPLPETMKEHAIIEKTAKFIASQDAQMEILLKTKQANNPLFDFLNQNGRLFRYYRHVLLAFRTNQYPIATDQQAVEQNGNENGTDVEQQNSEAAAQLLNRPKVIVPAIKYKPSVDCAYTQLISKITGAPIPTMVAEEAGSTTDVASAGAQPLTALNTEVDYYTEGSTPSVEIKKVSTGLAGLVQYDSDSGDSEEDGTNEKEPVVQHQPGKRESPKKVKELPPFKGVVPAVTIQHVIDRTAIYVAKNGYSFEEALRAKNDARFVFLNQAHEYYPYYAYRVRQRMNAGEAGLGLLQPPSPPPAKVRMETENGIVVETTPSLGIKAVHTAAPKAIAAPVTNIQHQKLGAPVSFSLVSRKSKEDGGAVKTMPGLGSDEEEDGDKETKQQDIKHQETNSIVQSTEAGDNVGKELTADDGHERKDIAKSPNALKQELENDLLVDGADVLEEAVVASSAIERLEREPAVAKEKQAERKKRANMFLNLIKAVGTEKKVERPYREPTDNGASDEKLSPIESSTKELPASDAEEGSIHSVRSTTPSPKQTAPKTPTINSNLPTTVIDDDDDDDVVLVSETLPKPRSRSRNRGHSVSDPERSSNGTDRHTKKKKSKSRHRSSRSKKKSKKKSRSRSQSRSGSERSSSRYSRGRKSTRSKTRRDRTRSRSHGSNGSNSTSDDTRVDRAKRTKKSKRATRTRSISRLRSRSRSPHRRSSRSRSRSKSKRSRKRKASVERNQQRRRRSRSRSRRNSDSDGEYHARHRGQPRRTDAGVGRSYEYDERYPPARARYWEC